MKAARGLLTAVVAVLTAMSALGAAAWACTASAELYASPDAGPAASQTRVEGYRFDSASPVEIRWNSRTGPVLATVAGPNFSVQVTIPASAQVGDYVIVGINVGGSFAPATPFRVTSGGSSAGQGGGSGSRTGTVSSGGSQSTPPPAPEQSETPPAANTAPPAGPGPEAAEPPAPPSSGSPRSDGRVGSTAAAPAPAASSPASSVRDASQPAGNAAAGDVLVPESTTGAVEVGPAPSARSASDDMWGGFAGDGRAAAHGWGAALAPSDANGGGLLVGALLSVAGLLLLAGAGFGLRRQRRLARIHQ